jgi:two-component system sensor histidine kinase PhcS
MSGASEGLFTAERPETFEEAQSRLILFYSRVAAYAAIVLVLAGVGLDQAFYPDEAVKFGIARVLVSVLIGLFMLSFRTDFGSRRLKSLTYIWVLFPQIMIAWMIYYTDGESSVYFVGLALAISAIGVFMPLTYFPVACFIIFTVGAYITACVMRSGGVENWPQLLGQSLFLVFYGIVAIIVSIYGDRWRKHSHQLGVKVYRQAQDLAQSNKALVSMQGELLQREKMAAVGTLAAGLLHELGNPVNYSLMAVSLAAQKRPEKLPLDVDENLVDAKEGLLRIQSIISDLKTFAYEKRGDATLQRFALQKVVGSALRLTGHELKGIQVEVDIPIDTEVQGDESAITSVFINLLSNAASAVHKAGREAPSISIRQETRAKRVHIFVRDNGVGISPALRARVFDPFFTTRDLGVGLGLGLSVSHGIVSRHGGAMTVDSEEGGWTEFRFDLPVPNEPVYPVDDSVAT